MKQQPIIVTETMVEAALVVFQNVCPSSFLSLDYLGRWALMSDIYIAMELEKVNESSKGNL